MIQEKLKDKINFYDWITKRSKLNMFICSSWFQKSIRRWDILDIINYTKEIIESWNINYIWKRIFIILVEDIWLANLYLWELILKSYKKFRETETYNKFDDTTIYQATLLLAYSQKSRENDNFYHAIQDFWFWEEKDKEFIKTYCRIKYFLSNSKSTKQELKEIFDREFKNNMNQKLYDIYIECMNICWELWWKDWLNLYFINFYLIKKYNLWFEYYKTQDNLYKEEAIKLLPKKLDLSHLEPIIPKDYVFDKHTPEWKSLKRWMEHFLKEWCFLNNEVRVWENIYTDFIKKQF